MKNIITLHEAIVLALISFPDRRGSFEDIAGFIDRRGLFPERKGGISLDEQVMLRSTKCKGQYNHLFEQVDLNRIRLKNI